MNNEESKKRGWWKTKRQLTRAAENIHVLRLPDFSCFERHKRIAIQQIYNSIKTSPSMTLS